MLGKMIRHEFRSTFKIMCVIYAAIAAVTVVGIIFYQIRLGVFEKIADTGFLDNAGFSEGILNSLMVVITVAYVLILMTAGIGTVIFLSIRFYKSCYGDEGYLTQMLPVTKNDIIISKALTAWVWSLGTAVLTYLSVLRFLMSVFGAVMDWSEVWETFADFKNTFGLSPLSAALSAITLIASSVAGIFMIYAAVSMGQSSAKHKVVMSILWYMVFHIINQTASSVLFTMSGFLNLSMTNGANADGIGRRLFMGTMGGTFIIDLAVIVVGYLIVRYVMERNLNLE